MQDFRVPFTLYVVWHPDSIAGSGVSECLQRHFSTYGQFGGAGEGAVHVIFRSLATVDAKVPLPIDWADSDATAVVVLLDRALVVEPDWIKYVQGLVRQAAGRGLNARVFPVAMEPEVLGEIEMGVQALRWDRWTEEDREQRLCRDLKHEFARMLKYRLSQLRNSSDEEKNRTEYQAPVSIFLSHSKHDAYGASVSRRIRDWLHRHSSLGSFMDVHDIPPGLEFHEVIMSSMRGKAVVIIYTDSYSSREWCRREAIEAKRLNLPMLMVDCLQESDERAFPYLGNMPVLRLNPDRTDMVVDRLLGEVFEDLLWQCRIERLRQGHPTVLFMARPPELLSLACLPTPRDGAASIVYPDPPMGMNEVRLFTDIVSDVHLHSLTEWLAGGSMS